jgi:enolase-phosphatase E1
MSETVTAATPGSEPTPKLYLLDVEGTTSPVSLVYEQLFPYARKHLEPYLRANLGHPDVQADLTLLAAENVPDREVGQQSGCPILDAPLRQGWEEQRPGWEEQISAATAYLHWLMDQDRKSTALKSLQGKIWKSGFENGELKGTVFPDVPAALARWSQKAKVAIYSSGSVEAQQLLFRHSSAGDLTPLISAYFDTRTGPKTSPDSYRAIAAAMSVAATKILFISDLIRELDPAREAGCGTRLSLRPGNQPLSQTHAHIDIRSFEVLV